MDPLRDWVAKHRDARRQLTEAEIARDYTAVCETCGGPARPNDRGQCLSCWKEEHLS